MVIRAIITFCIGMSVMSFMLSPKTVFAKPKRENFIYTLKARGLVTGENLLKWQKKKDFSKILLLDVRSEGDYQEGHIPMAVSCPLSQLKEQVDRLRNVDREIWLYGSSDVEGKEACEILLKEGFKARPVEAITAYPQKLVYYQVLLMDEFIDGLKEKEAIILDGRKKNEVKKVLSNAAGINDLAKKPLEKKWLKGKEHPIYILSAKGGGGQALAQKLIEAGYKHVKLALLGTTEYDYYPL